MIPTSILGVILLASLIINTHAASEDIREDGKALIQGDQSNVTERPSVFFSLSSETEESGNSDGEEEEGEATPSETLFQMESTNHFVFTDIKDRQKFRKLETKEKNELETSKEDEFLDAETVTSTMSSSSSENKEETEEGTENRKINSVKMDSYQDESQNSEDTEERAPQESKVSEQIDSLGTEPQTTPSIRRQGDIGHHSSEESDKVQFDDLRYDQTPPISPPPPPYPPQNNYDLRIRNEPRVQQSQSNSNVNEDGRVTEPQLLLTFGGYQRPFDDRIPGFQPPFTPRGTGQQPQLRPPFPNAVDGFERRPSTRAPSQGGYVPSNSQQAGPPDQAQFGPFQPPPYRPPIIEFNAPSFVTHYPGPPPAPVAFVPVQQTSGPFPGYANEAGGGYQSPSPVFGSNLPTFSRDSSNDFFSRPPPSRFPGFIFGDFPSGGFPPSEQQGDVRFVQLGVPSPPPPPPTRLQVEHRPFGSVQQESNVTMRQQHPSTEPIRPDDGPSRPDFNSFRDGPVRSPSLGTNFQPNNPSFYSRPDLTVGPPSDFFSPFTRTFPQQINLYSGFPNSGPPSQNDVRNFAPYPKEPSQQSKESESGSEKEEPEPKPQDAQKVAREAPFGSRLTPTNSNNNNPFTNSLRQAGYSNELNNNNSSSSEEDVNNKPTSFSRGAGFPGPRQQYRQENSFGQSDRPLYSQLQSIRGPIPETTSHQTGQPAERNVTSNVPEHSFFGSVPFQPTYNRPPQSDIFREYPGSPQLGRNQLPAPPFSNPVFNPFGNSGVPPSSPESAPQKNNDYQYFSIGDQGQIRNIQDNSETPVCAQKANISICFEDDAYPRNDILYSMESDRYISDRLLVAPTPISRSSLVEGGGSSDETGDAKESENYVCKSLVKYGQPKRAKNTQGQWKILVNLEDGIAGGRLSQSVRLEVCSNPGTECSHTSKNVATQCVQKYNIHQMLVWTPGRGLNMDVFKFPVACSCSVMTKK